MTENTIGWLVAVGLIVVFLMAFFLKKPVKSKVLKGRSRYAPSVNNGATEFFAGFDDAIEQHLINAASVRYEPAPQEECSEDDTAFELPHVRPQFRTSECSQKISHFSVKPQIALSKTRSLSAPKNLGVFLIVIAFLSVINVDAFALSVDRPFTGSDEHTVYRPFDEANSDPVYKSAALSAISVPTDIPKSSHYSNVSKSVVTDRSNDIATGNQSSAKDSNTWFFLVIGILLIIVGFGIAQAYSLEMVFFSDSADMWLSIAMTVVVGCFCFIQDRAWLWSGFGFVVIYHFLAAYKFNPGMGAMALVIGISRVIIGVIIPVIAFFTLISGPTREKDESAASYQARCAMHTVFKAAFLTGLFFFMKSLVNGQKVRDARGDFDNSDDSSESRSEEKTYRSGAEGASAPDGKTEDSKKRSEERPSDHEILGVPPDATFEVIQRAYRKKMMKIHPDRMAGLGAKYRQKAEDECKKINVAFERLRKARSHVFV